MHTGYYFTSIRFAIDPTEDEETNPGRYGKAVARWLSDALDKSGYQTDIFPEDWGWRVLCDFTDDYQLFIGCGNVDGNVDSMTDIETINHGESVTPPEGGDVVWHVFPQIEARPFRFATLLKKWRDLFASPRYSKNGAAISTSTHRWKNSIKTSTTY